jgi:hypothetical protein
MITAMLSQVRVIIIRVQPLARPTRITVLPQWEPGRLPAAGWPRRRAAVTVIAEPARTLPMSRVPALPCGPGPVARTYWYWHRAV